MKRLDKLWFVFFQPGVLSQAQFGHKITQVTGSDRDTGVNAALTYSINSVLNINEYGDEKVVPAHTFTISKSDGSVSLNDSLLLYHRDYFEVDVGIEDGSGSKTSSKLRVSIFPFVCLKSPTIEVFKRWCPSPLYKNVKNVRSLPELGQSLGIKSWLFCRRSEWSCHCHNFSPLCLDIFNTTSNYLYVSMRKFWYDTKIFNKYLLFNVNVKESLPYFIQLRTESFFILQSFCKLQIWVSEPSNLLVASFDKDLVAVQKDIIGIKT